MNDDKQAIKDNTGYYIVAQCKPHQKMQGITKMLVMVSYMINVTFNNISAISWRSVLLMEETGVPGENHWPAASQ
jgi:hypothetical protein